MSIGSMFFRICLIITNIIVLIAGATLGGFGIFLLVKARQFDFTSIAYGVPAFITILGFIVLGVALLGCVGAIALNRAILISFAIAVGIIILSEMAGGVLLVVYKDKVKDGVGVYFQETIKAVDKHQNTKAENALKELQTKFQCCGANSPNDWSKPGHSCCKSGQSSCADYPDRGCVEVVYEWMKQNLLIVAAVVLIFAVTEIGAIVAAAYIIKKGEYV